MSGFSLENEGACEKALLFVLIKPSDYTNIQSKSTALNSRFCEHFGVKFRPIYNNYDCEFFNLHLRVKLDF